MHARNEKFSMLTSAVLFYQFFAIRAEDERLGEPSEYCGGGLLPSYPEPEDDSMIVSVHTFFRHGTRAEYRRTTCFPNDAYTSYTSSLQSQFDITGISKDMRGGGSLTKRYRRGFQVGELLDNAQIQMKMLAKYLREAYPRQFSVDNLEKLFLRSTDIQRTLGSLDLLLSNIAPGSSLVVETDDFDYDSLNLNCQSCSRAVHILNSFPSSPAYQSLMSGEQFKKCAEAWNSEIGTPFDITQAHDCLVTPACADVPLPLGITPSALLVRCVTDIAREIRTLRYASPDGVEFCQLATAPFIGDLIKLSERRISGLWATHDDTLVCILSSSGLWDGVWPSYASFISFETFADNRVRVLQDGFEIGWLNKISDLLRPDIQVPDGYMRACASSDDEVKIKTEEAPNWSVGSVLGRAAGVIGLVGLVAYL